MRKLFLLLFALANISVYSQNTATTDEGVVVGGVRWATRNVASSGSFVANPQDNGGFFTWAQAQNACPSGWRLPTQAEFESLINAGSVWTTENGVLGRLFGIAPNQIFLPTAGVRYGYDGSLHHVNEGGYYWSSSQYNVDNAVNFWFRGDKLNVSANSRLLGFSVRCVSGTQQQQVAEAQAQQQAPTPTAQQRSQAAQTSQPRTTQGNRAPSVFLTALGVLGILFLAYLLFNKKLFARYTEQKTHLSEKTLKRLVKGLQLLFIVYVIVLAFCILVSGTIINFQIQWNMFESRLIYPLLVIGFILGLGAKFNFIPLLVTKDQFGNTTKVERDYDVISNMEASFIAPLLMYFVIGPVFFAAMIYYPLMMILHLFGRIFPFLIIAFFVFTIVLFCKWQKVQIKSGNIIRLMPAACLTGILLWLLAYTWLPFAKAAIIVHIAAGVFITITLLLFRSAIKKGTILDIPMEVLSKEEDISETPAISRKLLIAYIVSLVFIICIYAFRVA